MGSCHVEVKTSFLEYLENHSDVTIIRKSEGGDGYYIVLLETPLLSDGYHGVKEIFTWPDSPNVLRFRRDTDT